MILRLHHLCLLVMCACCTPLGAQQQADDATRASGLVCVVKVIDEEGQVQSYGGGVVVGTSGNRIYIATPFHVVKPASVGTRTIKVMLRFRPGEDLVADSPADIDRELDLAVLVVKSPDGLDIDTSALPFGYLGDTEDMRRGDNVHTVAHPHRVPWRLSAAPEFFVSARGSRVLFQSPTLAPGASGGGLFNNRWELIGMIQRDGGDAGRALSFQRLVEQVGEWGYPVDFRTAASISGKWESKSLSAPFKLDIRVLGDEVYGTLMEGDTHYGVLEGRISGDRLAFHIVSDKGSSGRDRRIRVHYRGTIAGDRLDGVRQSEEGNPPIFFTMSKVGAR